MKKGSAVLIALILALGALSNACAASIQLLRQRNIMKPLGKRIALTTALIGLILIPSTVFGQMAYLREFGGTGSSPGQFNFPTGISVAPDGSVYVMDTGNGRVQHLTATGQVINVFGGGFFSNAVGISVAPAVNRLYVANANADNVLYFDLNGTYLGSFGSQGTGIGQFTYDQGVAFSNVSGFIYAVDDDSDNRIQIFDPDGTYIGGWKALGYAGDIGIGPNGDVFVTSYCCGTNAIGVDAYTSSGAFLRHYGSGGSGPGQFVGPAGVAITDQGIFIADYANPGGFRVEHFSLSGDFIEQVGTLGSGPGQFNKPYGVAVSPVTGELFVTDSMNNRVQVFSISPIPEEIAACNGITLTGNAMVDSYDSTNGSYASQVGAGGHAGSDGNVQTRGAGANITLFGEAAVYGNASATRSVITFGRAKVYGTTSQKQPISVCDPLDVATLVKKNRPSGRPTSITLSGKKTETLLAPGPFYLSGVSLSGESMLTISGTGNATVFIDGDLVISGRASFIVPNGVTLTIYITGNIFIAGGGIVNRGPSTDLTIYASASKGRLVTIGGNADLGGALYAPLSTILVTGNSAIMGAVRGMTVTGSGNVGFHYDEASTSLLLGW